MKSQLLVLATAFVLSVFAPIVATAQVQTRLDYRAPAECPDKFRFADELAARVGFQPFAASAQATITVRISRDDSGPTVEFVGTLGLAIDGERAYRSGSCDDLVETMAAAAVVAFSPRAVAAPPPVAWAPGPDARPDGWTGERPATVRVSIHAPPDRRLRLELHQTTDLNARVTVHDGRTHEYMCVAPCEVRLDVGNYDLTVSNGGPGHGIHIHPPMMLDHDTDLYLDFDDRSELRLAGGLAGVFGVLGGFATGGAGAAAEDIASGLFVVGLGVILASTVVGMVLLFLEDAASVSVTPTNLLSPMPAATTSLATDAFVALFEAERWAAAHRRVERYRRAYAQSSSRVLSDRNLARRGVTDMSIRTVRVTVFGRRHPR